MYNEAAFAKLDQVMKCADDHGLMVTLRIGYCWDYSGDASLPERYAGVVQDGSNDRKLWLDYCKTIYDRVSDYGNFQVDLLPGRTSGTIRQTWTGISLEPSVSVWHPDADIRIT